MKLYRYKNVGNEIMLEEWIVEEESEKSLHLFRENHPKDKKMMRRNAKNRFARETKKEAFDDFILRKEREIDILKRRQGTVREVLIKAEYEKARNGI